MTFTMTGLDSERSAARPKQSSRKEERWSAGWVDHTSSLCRRDRPVGRQWQLLHLPAPLK